MVRYFGGQGFVLILAVSLAWADAGNKPQGTKLMRGLRSLQDDSPPPPDGSNPPPPPPVDGSDPPPPPDGTDGDGLPPPPGAYDNGTWYDPEGSYPYYDGEELGYPPPPDGYDNGTWQGYEGEDGYGPYPPFPEGENGTWYGHEHNMTWGPPCGPHNRTGFPGEHHNGTFFPGGRFNGTGPCPGYPPHGPGPNQVHMGTSGGPPGAFPGGNPNHPSNGKEQPSGPPHGFPGGGKQGQGMMNGGGHGNSHGQQMHSGGPKQGSPMGPTLSATGGAAPGAQLPTDAVAYTGATPTGTEPGAPMTVSQDVDTSGGQFSAGTLSDGTVISASGTLFQTSQFRMVMGVTVGAGALLMFM